MNQDILFITKNETLIIIKEEGEKNLLGIQNVEDVITNKSNSLMQILIPILIVLLGFCINSIATKNFNWQFQLSTVIIILLGIVIYILYQNILPAKSAIQGTEPNQLVQLDMIIGDIENDNRNILVNRVFNLQKAINYSTKSHSIRYKRFKNANKTLFLGLLIIFILFSLLQAFLLFQDMC